MSGRRLAVVIAGWGALASPARGQDGGLYRWTHVSYVRAAVVAIDVGTADGVRNWTRLEVVRRGVPIALLEVSSLGDHQARCIVVSRGAAGSGVTVGDSVRFLPLRQPGTQPLATAPVTSAPAAPSVAVRPPPARVSDSTKTGAPAVAPTPRVATPQLPVMTAPAVAPQTAPVAPPVSTTASPAPAPSSAPPQVPTAAPMPASAATPAGASPAAQPPASGKPRMARVTFLTTVSVYIDAGISEGLAEGSRVDVLHGGTSVAELKVAFVSTHQASCQVVSKAAPLAVGDSVRFIPVAGPAGRRDSSATLAAAGPATQGAVPGTTRRSNAGRLRGRIGLYYLTVQQQDSLGGRFSQPSGDIRLTGGGLGGTGLGLVADLRTRRLVQALPGTPSNTTDQTRVYQALLYWQSPGSPFRFTTGRQYAPGITSVGLIDGAAVELSQPAWDYGVFGGMSPDPVSLGFSGDSLTQLGGYVRRHNRFGSLAHWSVTAGASGSYVSWHTNREFFYAQGNYQSRRLSLYAVQEVDYYRNWRRVGTNEKMLSPTSTFANVQYQVTDAVSVNAGIDNRRNVRLYYYVINPAILFDDTFRRGVWAGAAARLAGHFQVTVDARTNHDDTFGDANTYTLGLGADRLTSVDLSLRSRSTRYTMGRRQGWLNSLSLGLEPFGRSSVQLTSGWRTEHDTSTAPTLNVRWLSADIDVSLARSLFAILSMYRERGGIEAHDLLYTGLSYRF
ncbi:MAG TPA: hypothetical protein VFP39_14585 [Gemmatimonadales bacterium]|nr:hypothetical protein [Gemmatimonadales bacterium]